MILQACYEPVSAGPDILRCATGGSGGDRRHGRLVRATACPYNPTYGEVAIKLSAAGTGAELPRMLSLDWRTRTEGGTRPGHRLNWMTCVPMGVLMTPREVVCRAIEFRHPPRLPINGYGEVSDVIGVPHEPVKPPAGRRRSACGPVALPLAQDRRAQHGPGQGPPPGGPVDG